jgi:hypothetical protein
MHNSYDTKMHALAKSIQRHQQEDSAAKTEHQHDKIALKPPPPLKEYQTSHSLGRHFPSNDESTVIVPPLRVPSPQQLVSASDEGECIPVVPERMAARKRRESGGLPSSLSLLTTFPSLRMNQEEPSDSLRDSIQPTHRRRRPSPGIISSRNISLSHFDDRPLMDLKTNTS